MNHFIKQFLTNTLCFLMAAGFLLTSASCSKDVPSVQESATYTLRLQLNTGGIFTRASWEDDWYGSADDGSVFDNTISSVELYLVGDDGRMAPMYALEEPGSAARMFVCNVDSSTPGVTVDENAATATFNGKIMAIANAEFADTPWFSSDLADCNGMPFEIGFGESRSWKIPMWGIASYSDIQIEAGKVKQLADIDMLRAVSKVEIKLDESLVERFEIASVRMADNSPSLKKGGYLLPEQGLSVTSTGKLPRDRCVAFKEDGSEFEQPCFRNTTSGSMIAYFAESRLDDPASPFAFEVTLNAKDGSCPPFTGILYLSEYRNDNPAVAAAPIREVVRNHIYQFTIKLAELYFIPSVRIWEFGAKVHLELE